MNDLITKKDQKTRKVLIILSCLSFAFTILFVICLSLTYKFILEGDNVSRIIVYMLCRLLTYILLIIFIIKEYGSEKYSVFIPIVLAVAACSFSTSVDGIDFQIDTLCFGIAAVCSFTKISNKLVFIITSVLCLLDIGPAFVQRLVGIIAVCFSDFEHIIDYLKYYSLAMLEHIAICLFCIIWLIIGIKSKIPSVITKKPESDVATKAKQNVQNGAECSLEKSLQEIEEQHNLGLISDEDYKLKRAEIIDKL